MNNYKSEIWANFTEERLLDFLQMGFENCGYNVVNYHKIDRAHEDAIDLLCTKSDDQIALQAKMKPKKGDCNQFDRLLESGMGKKIIYACVNSPTKEFSQHTKDNSSVNFWYASEVHNFLVKNEVVPYYCLYFSKHPLILALTKVHELISEKRNTHYNEHRFSAKEIATLWIAKDNVVKAWVSLYYIFQKWNFILMSKTDKDPNEFEKIIIEVFKDLDSAFDICGTKFLSSFETLSENFPDLLGLLWKLASERSNWFEYTRFIDNNPTIKSNFFTEYSWICPVFNESLSVKMKGFYSSLNYLLENFSQVSKNIEDSIDWVFQDMNKVDRYSNIR